MDVRRILPRSSDERLAWLASGLVLALGAVAYWPLLWNALHPPTTSQLEGWLFRPSQLPPLLILAVSSWFLWRRRARLRSLPVRRAPVTAAFWVTLGGALFVWAHLTRASDLFLPSLSAQLLAFAALVRGRAGCRAVALPALTLLLAVQIPGPLQDEILWRLQLGTTSSAAWLLQSLGREVVKGGVILRTAGHSFHVIDGCSGMRGIQILTLVALIVRELFAGAGWRPWLLLPIAPVLGFALNVVRIAYVADSPNPEALAGMQGDHTPQGLAVLIAGTAILYGLGLALAGKDRSGSAHSEVERAAEPTPRAAWWLAAGWLSVLLVLAVVVPPFENSSRATTRPHFDFPERPAGWISESLIGEPLFFAGGGQALHRRYQPVGGGPLVAEESVELFVGFEEIGSVTTSPLLSSKIGWPGPDWELESSGHTPVWVLQRDADLTIASRPPSGEHAVVYTWRLGDRGLWRESVRSFLALDSTPFRRERARTVVRLICFAPHDGTVVLDKARQRLDRFISRFQKELTAF